MIANQVTSSVTPILGDIRVVAKKFDRIADRIIMNLPEKAWEFVDIACRMLRPNGGTVHFYSFESAASLIKAEEQLRKTILEANRILQQVISKRRVKQIAPKTWQVVFDIRIR